MRDNADANVDAATVHRRSNWLIAAVVLSLVYVVAVALVVGSSATTAPFMQRLLNLELNGLGDFLAGLFAPLAFLWLAAAVAIQSQELAEQRRELALTRREFEETRRVATAQAEFIGVQTEIMRAERADRERGLVEQDLEALLDQLEDVVRPAWNRVRFTADGLVFRFQQAAPTDREELFHGFRMELIGLIISMEHHLENVAGAGVNADLLIMRQALAEVVEVLEEIENRKLKAFARLQLKLRLLRLDQITSTAKELMQIVDKRSRPPSDPSAVEGNEIEERR